MLIRFINWLASFSPAHADLKREADRDRFLVTSYARALREIVNTTGAVRVPNGTTQKVSRIANGAFETAMASLYDVRA